MRTKHGERDIKGFVGRQPHSLICHICHNIELILTQIINYYRALR
jgi:hypothetical protein